MIKFSELVKTKEVKIQNTDIKIEIYLDWSWYDQMVSAKIKDNDERALFLLTKIVKSWNIVNEEDNKPLPVSEDIIKRLPDYIMKPLFDELASILDTKNQKKKS